MNRLKRAAAIAIAVLIMLNSVVICLANGYNTMKITLASSSRISYSGVTFTSYSGTYTRSGKTYAQRAFSVAVKPDNFTSVRVADGGGVYGKKTLSQQISSFDVKEDERVVAAVNADFFALSTGVPLGVQISDGVVQSTNSYEYEASVGRYSVGFRQNGSAFVGIPHFQVGVRVGGTFIEADRLNSYPDCNLVLLTDDYSDRTYWNTSYAHDVIVFEADGDMRVDVNVGCRLESYLHSVTQPVSIEKNHLYLIAPEGDEHLAVFANLQTGTSASAVVRDLIGGWSGVKEAVGGGNLLINGGTLRYTSTYDQSISGTMTSRSAIGIKPDGSVILYAAERDSAGEQSGGMPVEAVAQALYNIGCSFAVNFDGGGSTTISASENGGVCNVKNSCQDGSERRVANSLVIVCTERAPAVVEDFDRELSVNEKYSGLSVVDVSRTGQSVYTGSGAMKVQYRFAGDSTTVGFDFKNTYDVSSFSHMTISVLGDSSGATLYAVLSDGGGEYKVQVGKIDFSGWKKLEFGVWGAKSLVGFTVNVPQNTVKSGVAVLDRLTGYIGFSMTDNTAPSVGSVQNGQLLSLSAWDGMYMSGQDNSSFTCTVDGVSLPVTGATVDLSGITGNKIKRAVVEVTDVFGNRAQKVALFRPSGYDTAMPYSDVNDSGWDSLYIRYCTEKSVINGFTENGLRTFRGSESITRAQFCAMLVRSRGISINKYAGVSLPYEDVSDIPAWAMLYVKAAYATGIMTGSATSTGVSFYARNNITRQEAACAVDKMGVYDGRFAMNSSYSDSGEISRWAAASVERMSACGIFNGEKDGGFYPRRQLSRSESAAIMTRLG